MHYPNTCAFKFLFLDDKTALEDAAENGRLGAMACCEEQGEHWRLV